LGHQRLQRFERTDQHADIRQTAKYTHIGMENKAEALRTYRRLSHLHLLIARVLSAIRAALRPPFLRSNRICRHSRLDSLTPLVFR
jgi:hypothetical protein